jgi:hypothetical protein
LVEWRETGAATWNSDTTAAGATSYQLTGLSTQVEYEWQLTADCGGGDNSSTIAGTNFVTVPVNDDCSGAIALTVGVDCNYDEFSNVGATDSGVSSPGCGNYQGSDVWFSVTVPSTGNLLIDTDTGDITDGAMAAYSGDCANLTLIECDDDDSDNGSMPKLELSGLTAGETIYIRFWEYGGNTFGSFSICVTNFCPAPSDGQATNITATSADLSWTAGNSETTWNIEYGEAGFTQGQGTTVQTTNNPFNISSLNPNTEYQWYVQAVCDASSTSDWAGPYSFSTPCETITPDYLQDFANYLPDCWQVAEGPESGPTSYGSSGWSSDGFINNGATGATKFNLWNAGDQDWLISPGFDLSLGEYQLEFDVAVTEWGNQNPSAMGSDDQVKLLISTDGGNTWASLLEWDSNNVPSNTGDHIIVDLANYTQNNVKFAFWANEGDTDDAEDYDFFVDNFLVHYPPCPGQPIIPDYTQDFNHYLPSCWKEARGEDGSSLTYLNNRWTNDGFLNQGTTGAARLYMYGNTLDEWLISPFFDISAGGYELQVRLGITAFSNGGGATMGPDDFVKVMGSQDGVNWIELMTFDASNQPSNLGDYYNIDLSQLAQVGVAQVALYASTGDSADPGYNFYIDYFNVVSPSCQAPSDLNAIVTGSTTTTLTWIDNADGLASYIVEWKQATETTWNSTTTGIDDTSLDLTGLTPDVIYNWRVTTDCGSGTLSVPTTGDDFIPTCVPIIPDYFEDFSVYLSECWKEGKGNMTSYSVANSRWTNDGFANNGTSGAARIRLYNNSYDSWLVSPVFNLSAGGYSLSMDVAVTKFSGTNPSAMGADDLVALKVTTDGGATWVDLMTWDVNNTPSNTGETVNIDLSSYTAAEVQFAVVASDGSAAELAYNFYVDNFYIGNTSTRPTALQAIDVDANITQNQDIFKVSAVDETLISNIIVYDLSGRVIYSAKNVNRSIFNTNIHVSAGSILIFHIKMKNSEIIIKKVIKQ